MEVRGSVPSEELLLRDELAIERTHLANERTLLAYARTGLACLVVGLGGVSLLDPLVWRVVAWSFVALAPAILGLGLSRFLRCRRTLHAAPRLAKRP